MCVCVCVNKPSPVIAYVALSTRKKRNKNGDLFSMLFKGLAFFADVKRKVAKAHRHRTITMITA